MVTALLTLLAVAVIALLPARGPADAATISLPPARAAALIQATSGDESIQMRAVGDQAKVINAALPFAGGPVLSARPFEVSGSDVDQRRALLCLTQAVYYEAGFEPLDGRRAVAQVVLNRMRHPAFPKSVCGVVYQRNSTPVCQFSFVCDGSLVPPARQRRLEPGRADSPRRARRSRRTFSWLRYPLSRRLCRSALGAPARQGRQARPAYLLSLAGRMGSAGRVHRPLHRRASRPARDAPAGHFDLHRRQPTRLALQAIAGPPVPRAENDVGGLLDPTKGWTLSIPGPEDSGSSAAKLIAQQQAKPAPAPVADVATTAQAGPAIASR